MSRCLPAATVALFAAALLVSLSSCSTGAGETLDGVFDSPLNLGEIDADVTLASDVPSWDYPDIQLGEGKITRLIWMSRGEANALKSIVDRTPHVTEKRVGVAVVTNFPGQLQRDSNNGRIQKLNDVGLEAISLTGAVEDVDEVTDVIVGVQKSIPQVEIEIRVVEILEEDGFSFGIDTFVGSGDNPRPEGRQTDNVFNSARTALGLPPIQGGGGSFNPGALATPFLADLGTSTGGLRIDFIIRALKLFARTDVLSAPHIRVLNGHTAEITAGQEIPFFQPAFNNSGFSTVTTSFKNVGIKLFIIPSVVGRDLVRINLTTSVETVTGQSTFETENISVTNPVITKRQASTFMDVHDGDTAIIGGLLTRSRLSNENRVPVLGDIPIVNFLFSSRTKETIQSNLIFFIRPRVIDPSRDRRRMITPAPPAPPSDASGEEEENG